MLNVTYWRVMMTAGLLACVASLRADDWENYQGNLQHTGYSNATFDPTQLSLSWTASIGFTEPLIVNNQVIAVHNGLGDHTPTAIDSFALSNGALNWSYTGSFASSQAAYGNGLVAFVAQDPSTSAQSLYVLDASTGGLKYTVALNIPRGEDFVPLPVIAKDPLTGDLMAYCATGVSVTAVKLGVTSGSVLWKSSGDFGGESIPTLLGNSLILAGPGQYYAIDASTGTSNHFHTSGISGGGGTTVAADASRQEFYVMEGFNSPTPMLTAYQYVNNSTITQLWQKSGAGISSGASVAIGLNGDIYAAALNTLLEIDPTTGATIRSLGGQSFASGITPIVDGNALFLYSDTQTLIYSLSTFSLIKTLPGSRGSVNTAFDGPGAIDSSHFIVNDDGNGLYGIQVFSAPVSAPEPSGLVLLAVGATGLLGRRFQRRA